METSAQAPRSARPAASAGPNLATPQNPASLCVQVAQKSHVLNTKTLSEYGSSDRNHTIWVLDPASRIQGLGFRVSEKRKRSRRTSPARNAFEGNLKQIDKQISLVIHICYIEGLWFWKTQRRLPATSPARNSSKEPLKLHNVDTHDYTHLVCAYIYIYRV